MGEGTSATDSKNQFALKSLGKSCIAVAVYESQPSDRVWRNRKRRLDNEQGEITYVSRKECASANFRSSCP
jgi:hypothetical protein